MTSYTSWMDVRARHVERAGGESAVAAGKDELLATVRGHRLAEIRCGRSLTQQDIAERMGVTKGRVSQIEQGDVSGHDVLARYMISIDRMRPLPHVLPPQRHGPCLPARVVNYTQD